MQTALEPIYLDYAATSPLRPEAQAAWLEHVHLLNPGGQYSLGRKARAALETAREQIAAALGAEPIEVIFTASGTEADNLAITGFAHAAWNNKQPVRLVASPVEHPAVKEPLQLLAKHGAQVELLAIDHDSQLGQLELLDQPAAVATCMFANNETGAIYPVAELAARAAATGTPFHVDAVQAVGHVPVDFHQLGVTTLAASAHKFGGPRGCGFLLAKRSPAPQPVVVGGGQERGLRPGTADVASAAATAAALTAAVAEMAATADRLSQLRDHLTAGIAASIPDVIFHTPKKALPGHVHVSFPGAEGDSLLMLLDQQQICAATGSACSAGVNRASETLLAMGVSEQDARAALRFTLGPATTAAQVEHVLAVLPQVVAQARSAGMA